MKQTILSIVSIFFYTTFLFSQEKVFELADGFTIAFGSSKESFAISNEVQSNLMILLEEQNKFKTYLLDKEYAIKSKFLTDALPKKYANLLGYNIQQNKYNLFFSNNRNSKYGVQIFDFENKTSSIKQLDFKIKNEFFVETVNYNNTMYLFTVTRNSSELNIYTFDQNFEWKKHTLSLKELEFETSYEGLIRAHKIFSKYDIAKIETNNPNVIETTSKKIKIYQQHNKVILTFDHKIKKTHLYIINLDSFQSTYKTIDKYLSLDRGFSKSNSYVFDDKIFQIASSRKKMKFTVKKLETGEQIKEYKLNQGDSITFKNSPIIQEGGGVFPVINNNRVREMEKTSKYLRKISLADVGISAYKVGDKFNLILGGTKEIQNAGGSVPGFGSFGTLGTVTTATGTFNIGYNPTFYGYYGYTTSKSTYINCLFDKNFEHVDGEVQSNVYDHINQFEDDLKKEPKAVNIFMFNDRHHYGYYDRTDKKYKIYRFE